MSRSRIGKVLGITFASLGALIATAVLGASVVLQGPRLGAIIEGALPENRGKLMIGGVGWSLRALADLATDVPSPISLDGLKIIDPEGTVVLDVPHLEAKVKLRTLMKGSFSIHDLKAGKAMWRFAKMNGSEDIGFLAALEPKHPAPPPPPGPKKEPQGPGSFFHIVRAELGDLNVIFDFPGAWGLELRHARAAASLIQSAVDPKHPIFGFDAGPIVAEGGGWLRIMDDNLLPFDKVIINRISTTQDRADDIFLDLREARTGKTALVGRGYFTGIYGATSVPGAALHVEFHDAADAFNQVVAGKKIEGLTLSGEDASAVADLNDTFAALKVTAKFSGLDVAYAPYRALGVGFGLTFDGGAMKIGVRDFHFGAPGGGRFGLAAMFDATAMKLGADLRLQDFTTDSYVPPALQAIAGGHVNGRLHLDADLGPAGQSAVVHGLDLTLERRRAAGLPQTIRVHGDAVVSAQRFKTTGLTVEVPGANATAQGEVKLARQTVALALDLAAFDLARLLGSLGLPAVGKTAHLGARVDGSLTSPTASGNAVVTGLAVGKRATSPTSDFRAQFGLDAGLARLDAGSENLFGGKFHTRGTVRLYEKSTRHMLKAPIVDLDVNATRIDVGAASGTDLVNGHLSFQARVKGPVTALSGTVSLPAHQPLVVAGEGLDVGPVDVELDGQRVTIKQLRIARRAGGTVNITGTAGLDQTLALDVELRELNLAGLPGVAETGLDIKGSLGAKVHVGGSVRRPAISGTLELTDVAARGIALGNGRIEIRSDPTANVAELPDGAVALVIKADLFDRFHIDARVAQKTTGMAVHATAAFSKLVLESLVPELTALGDGHGLASGTVQFDLEPGKPILADLLLNELWLSLARAVEDAARGESTVQRVEISAAKPVHVTVAGDHIALEDLSLATHGGSLHASGVLDGKAIRANLKGHVDLELAEPFLQETVDKLTGDLDVVIDAGGTIDKPILRGAVTIQDPVHVRPKGFDTDVVVSSGAISLDPAGAEVRKLAISVDGATTQLDGRLTLGAGFRPETADAHIAGEISARLLGLVAGEAVVEPQGRVRIKADVKGRLDNPSVTAWLGLGTITFRLRDTGTLVEVQSGVVEVTNSGALLRDVRVLIDEQGKLTIGAAGVRPGQLEIRRLVPLQLGRLDLPMRGQQLSYRNPGTFEVNDLAFDLDLGGNLDDGFALGGEVRIIAGRYVQDFKLSNLVLSPRVNESAVRPFYDGKPLLEDLQLDLTVRTVGDAFVVQNNIAPEIHIDVALHVGGTLSEPHLAGDVRPTDGRFRIPVLRGDFDLVQNVNHITFVETKSVVDGDTPEIQIEAQNLVVDAAGLDHQVQMNIHGPVREMQIDLSTLDGLDRSQTALLLLTGRTTTASERLTTQNSTVGANVNTGLDIAGQATRDTIANLMEPIIGDTFERALGAQLRLTVGPDGFEFRLLKRISRYMKFQAEALQGFQGTDRQTLQFDQWLLDYFTFSAGVQRLVVPQQPGLNENPPVSGSLELRWDFAVRM